MVVLLSALAFADPPTGQTGAAALPSAQLDSVAADASELARSVAEAGVLLQAVGPDLRAAGVLSQTPGAAGAPGPVMSNEDFAALLAAVGDQAFLSGKLEALQRAALTSGFTIDQLGALLESSPFTRDHEAIAALLAPHVVDPQNAARLAEHLTFEAETRTILALFGL